MNVHVLEDSLEECARPKLPSVLERMETLTGHVKIKASVWITLHITLVNVKPDSPEKIAPSTSTIVLIICVRLINDTSFLIFYSSELKYLSYFVIFNFNPFILFCRMEVHVKMESMNILVDARLNTEENFVKLSQW